MQTGDTHEESKQADLHKRFHINHYESTQTHRDDRKMRFPPLSLALTDLTHTKKVFTTF